MHIHDREII